MTTPPTAATPPTTEQGVVNPGLDDRRASRLLGGLGLTSVFESWDPAPDWRWPKRIDTIDAMRRDSQVVALELGMFAPIRQWPWRIRTGNARPEVAKFVAEQLGLPWADAPADDKPSTRTRGRFSWAEHLRLVLRAPSYGAAWFEQVATLEDDGTVTLRKLAPRPLRTIRKVNVARDGGLVSIEQGIGPDQVEIGVERLVAYVWDADPGSWSGTSMLRALYRHYWLKDKLYRVDAMKHERFGAPMPIFEAPPEATEPQLEALSLLAQSIRSGERAGGSVPSGTKSHLLASTGAGTDVVASINMHDQAMTRSWAMMVVQLAQGGEGGNRALGGTFADLLLVVQKTVAEFVRTTTQGHVIEDLVDWNYGPNEAAPTLEFEAGDAEAAVAVILEALDKGAITADAETEAYIRKRLGVPDRVVEAPKGSPSFAYDQENGVITINQRLEELGKEPDTTGRGDMTIPEYKASLTAGTTQPIDDNGVDPITGEPITTAPVAVAASLTGRIRAGLQRLTGRRVTAADAEADPMLPDRPMRRQRTARERVAATDFRDLDQAWESAVDEALAAWPEVQAAQRDDLVQQIVEADGDLIALANLTAPVLGADILEAAMRTGIVDGIDAAHTEAAAQGITASKPSVDDAMDDVGVRAEAMATTLARSYGEVAGRYAMLAVGTNTTAEEVVASVTSKLELLTDAFLKDQIGAAVQGGQNAGRFAMFDVAGTGVPTAYVASEILDGNTCSACADIDGTEFADINAAMDAYPMLGGYDNCEGGPRCRGTVVAIYDEAGATVEVN